MKNITPLIPARIEQGKILWKEPVLLAKVLNRFNGKDVQVAINLPKNPRSMNQNNYYWGVVIEILTDWTGYEREETHDALRMEFLSIEKDFGGQTIRFARSTKTLDVQEFEDYLSKIREWASVQHNIFIPLPNQVEY
jgi:hypothetical protein